MATEPTPIRPRRGPAAPASAGNPIVLALVVALRDIQSRRVRGKVPSPSSRRPAA